MRVLWFTNTSACYTNTGKNTFGGGWVSSLELEIKKCSEIELGVCFYSDKNKKEFIDGTTYYPLNRPSKSFGYILKQLFSDKRRASMNHEGLAVPALLKVVNDFKPDIIQVFGSENIYGILVNYIDIPIVLHIQGILSACYNAFLPPGISWNEYLFEDWNPKRILSRYSNKFAWSRNYISEQRIFKKLKFVIGRTEWDKSISSVLCDTANYKYFHCDEILRDVFYDDVKRSPHGNIIFVSTISAFLYKGYDVILKTADILKNMMGLEFEWRVYGYVDTLAVHKSIRLSPESVNVRLMGLASAEQLRDALVSATAYIHPSYIENSSNAIGEAQMVGCPCIACDVGGVKTSIEDSISGYLVPANDIYLLASKMADLARNELKAERMGLAGKEKAIKRHDKLSICNRLLEIYQEILNSESKNTKC